MALRDLFRRRNSGDVRVYFNSSGVEVSGMDAAELYRTQPALRAVVSFLADNVAGLPLKAYIRQSDNDRPRDTTSTLAQLLLRPSETMTAHELMRSTVSDYLLYGNALWYPVESKDAPSGYEIVFIPWSWVLQESTFDGITAVEYVVTNPTTGNRAAIKATDCIRFYGYDPNGNWDSSAPIEALRQVLNEQIRAWRFRNSSWENGGQVSAWIGRPRDTPWSDGARERFAESWKNKFSGNGTDTGGTPLLEDGMELRSTQFNAREAQWAEATTLAREDVSAVYHVNPALIWHTDGQTYASAKDNARQLYADTLAPLLDMFEERINAFLVPRLGVDERTYVSFDLSSKLAGSFEERASVIQSAVGAPWLTRNEARAMNDLPALSDGDELIVPLNVVEGGLASPNDTDPTIERYSSQPEVKATSWDVKATNEEKNEIKEALRKFFERQKISVLNAMNAKDDEWWNEDRWNGELADDLHPILMRHAQVNGRRALRRVGANPDAYSVPRTENYLRAMAEGRAYAINSTTKKELDEALNGEFDEEAERSTPEGVFDYAVNDRAEVGGVSLATAVAGWGALEGIRQGASDSQATKTWVVNSGNPRPEHAAMNGETVPFYEEFSNGAQWPGDSSALDLADVCNCQCSLSLTIP